MNQKRLNTAAGLLALIADICAALIVELQSGAPLGVIVATSIYAALNLIAQYKETSPHAAARHDDRGRLLRALW